MDNSSRFVSFAEDQLEELLKAKCSKRTDSVTKNAVQLLETFCKETNQNTDWLQVNLGELNKNFMRFYAGVRKRDGEIYKINSMNGFRFAFQRYFHEIRGINIIGDQEFETSNKCFQNVLINIKKAGKGTVEYYSEIEPEDIQKLYRSDWVAGKGLVRCNVLPV